MRTIAVLMLALCGAAHCADSVSIAQKDTTVTVTITIDVAADTTRAQTKLKGAADDTVQLAVHRAVLAHVEQALLAAQSQILGKEQLAVAMAHKDDAVPPNAVSASADLASVTAMPAEKPK